MGLLLLLIISVAKYIFQSKSAVPSKVSSIVFNVTEGNWSQKKYFSFFVLNINTDNMCEKKKFLCLGSCLRINHWLENPRVYSNQLGLCLLSWAPMDNLPPVLRSSSQRSEPHRTKDPLEQNSHPPTGRNSDCLPFHWLDTSQGYWLKQRRKLIYKCFP